MSRGWRGTFLTPRARPSAEQWKQVVLGNVTLPESVDANAMAGTLHELAFSKVSRNRWTRLSTYWIFGDYPENIGTRQGNPNIEVCFQTGNLLVVCKRDVKCTRCEQTADIVAAASYLCKSKHVLEEDRVDVMRVHYFCTHCETWETAVKEAPGLVLREEDYDMWMERLSLRKNTRMRMGLVSSIGDIPLSVLAYSKGLSPVEVEPNTGILSCTVSSMRTARLESCKLSYERMVAEMCELNGTRTPRFLRDVEYTHNEGGVCASLFEDSMREVFAAVSNSPDVHNTVLLAAPCGSGKTTLALAVVQTLRETDMRGGKMLVLAPRSSLCDALHAKFAAQQEIKADGTLGDEKEMVHHYSQGYNTHGAKVVVSTVESLSRTISRPVMTNGKVTGYRQPECFDIVFVDEMHTLIKAAITQPTFKGPETRRQALRVLLLVLARARFVIFLDKDIGIIERLFVSLVVAQRCFGNPDQVQHRIWTLVSDRKVPIKYIRLKDDAAALNLAKAKLAEGLKVAVFEPSVARCRAFVEAINEVSEAWRELICYLTLRARRNSLSMRLPCTPSRRTRPSSAPTRTATSSGTASTCSATPRQSALASPSMAPRCPISRTARKWATWARWRRASHRHASTLSSYASATSSAGSRSSRASSACVEPAATRTRRASSTSSRSG